MKLNKQLKTDIEKYKDYIIIVEGKKDVQSLKFLGFEKVYAIHITGIPIRERAEQIATYITKKDRVCILTDLDKKGKQLYIKLKPIFQELGAKLDSNLRNILIKTKTSHIEGLPKILEKLEALQ